MNREAATSKTGEKGVYLVWDTKDVYTRQDSLPGCDVRHAAAFLPRPVRSGVRFGQQISSTEIQS